jgi:hypothetical protein
MLHALARDDAAIPYMIEVKYNKSKSSKIQQGFYSPGTKLRISLAPAIT